MLSAMDVDSVSGGGTGSARRRRERRLRQFLRHERPSVAMALSEMKHHTSRGQRKDRAGGEARVALHGHVPEAPLPQGRVLRHVVGHLPAPALDVPVPQMVDQLPNVVQFLAAQLLVVAEPVIEVPKILPHDIPPRRWCRDTQLVEQLVEVPTTVSYSSLQRTVEQHVDIPVPDGGGRLSGLQRFLPGQSSTAPTVVQIVDIPGGGLQGSRPGQVSPASSSFHSPAGWDDDADVPGQGVFRTILRPKKSAKLSPHSGSELLPESSPPTPAAQLEDSVEWVRLRDDNSGKPYFWNRNTRASAWRQGGVDRRKE